MPGTRPDPVWLFRMVHIANLPDVLERGMFSCRHPEFRPPVVRMGDVSLAEARDHFRLSAPAEGTIGEHVAFYFAGHSPMLLKIKNGTGIAQHHQRDVVYILVRFQRVQDLGLPYVVTDGHAKNSITRTFVTPEGLDEVDWDAVGAREWSNTEDDRDRMRRKQAECLVRDRVPREAIEALGVFDAEREREVSDLVTRAGLAIKVKVDRQRRSYYP